MLMIRPNHVVLAIALCGGIALVSPAARAQAQGEPGENDPEVEPMPPPDPAPGDQPAPLAEPAPPPAGAPQVMVPEPEAVARRWTVGLGLGVTKFSGSTADDAVDLGALLDLRVGVILTPLIGFEAAYIGSTQSINALGLDPGADLRSNGLEVMARFDLQQVATVGLGPLRVSPFLFAGLAVQRYKLADEGINTSNVASDDNVLAIPVGGGVGGMWGRITLDARFAYRSTYDEDLFRSPTGGASDASLSHWNLTARAGLAF